MLRGGILTRYDSLKDAVHLVVHFAGYLSERIHKNAEKLVDVLLL
jgi:hypothetical protein